MIQNYITVAWCNLLKYRVISFIMIVGLAASIAAFLLITQYVFSEFSYDEFHTKADNIYRIRLDDYKQGVLTNSSTISYYAEAPAMKETVPEVENFVRLHRADGMISYRKPTGELVSYYQKKAFYADSSLFTVFSFPLLKGAANQVLRRPESVVISATMAQTYFGQQNPIGKTLRLSTEWQGGTTSWKAYSLTFLPTAIFISILCFPSRICSKISSLLPAAGTGLTSIRICCSDQAPRQPQ